MMYTRVVESVNLGAPTVVKVGSEVVSLKADTLPSDSSTNNWYFNGSASETQFSRLKITCRR